MKKITNFWYKLKEAGKPILALAPMAGFTNSSFRIICKDQGVDVLYSEMASAAALHYAGKKNSQKNISDLNISALMIHGRTFKQGFTGDVDHKLIRKARKYFKGVILTNGGINNLMSAQQALIDREADGLGLARGVLGRPWLFSEIKDNQEYKLSHDEIFGLMIRQAKLLVKAKGEEALVELRKHLAWYAQGLKNAKFLREGLVKVESIKEIKKVIDDYKKL